MAEGIDDVLDFSLVPWGNAYVASATCPTTSTEEGYALYNVTARECWNDRCGSEGFFVVLLFAVRVARRRANRGFDVVLAVVVQRADHAAQHRLEPVAVEVLAEAVERLPAPLRFQAGDARNLLDDLVDDDRGDAAGRGPEGQLLGARRPGVPGSDGDDVRNRRDPPHRFDPRARVGTRRRGRDVHTLCLL